MADKPVVFISYAHKDLDIVRRIQARLKGAGLQPWIDDDDIRPGQKWLDAIKDAIRKADFFLLCLSPQSVSRRGVLQNEIRSALEVRREKLTRDIWFLPAWIQVGAPFPKDEMDELPEDLRTVQWANLGDPSGWTKLLDAINFQLARAGEASQVNSASSSTATETSLLKAAEPHVNELRAALKAHDNAAADAACRRLETTIDAHDGTLPDKVLRPALIQLSNMGWFALAGRLADACLRSGASAPYVRRCYAEALRRDGFHSAAVQTLTAARADASGDPTEWGDATFELASAYAARYRVGPPGGPTHAQAWITNAIALCDEVYRRDQRRNLLHGSAAAALTARASADGVAVAGDPPAQQAQAILDALAERRDVGSSLGPDDCAAGMIASLLGGDRDTAQRWTREFLDHAETRTADVERLSDLINSAWREDQSAIVNALMPRLPSRSKEPELVPRAQTSSLEVVLGAPEFITPAWLARGVEAARSVACLRVEGNAIATGFVLRGSDLRAEWGDDLVLLANSYVVTEDPAIRAQLAFSVPPVASIRVEFTGQDASGSNELRITKVLFSSPPDHLDVSVCRLESLPPDIKPLQLAKNLPLASPSSQVFLIGHPGGGSLKLSIDGYLLDHDDTKLHYTTASEPGSSGSPVFNQEWKVIGIHHAGSMDMPRLRGQSGTYAANEGISLLAIVKALHAD